MLVSEGGAAPDPLVGGTKGDVGHSHKRCQRSTLRFEQGVGGKSTRNVYFR